MPRDAKVLFLSASDRVACCHLVTAIYFEMYGAPVLEGFNRDLSNEGYWTLLYADVGDVAQTLLDCVPPDYMKDALKKLEEPGKKDELIAQLVTFQEGLRNLDRANKQQQLG